MQNGKQIDLSAHVERVKRKTRPWKSIIALLLAIAAAVISHRATNGDPIVGHKHDLTSQFIAVGGAVLFLVFGSIATYGLAGKSRQLLEPKAGPAHAAIVRYAILLVGAFTTLLITLVLFGIPVAQLVLGGALTTVFVSIAAQQALGNVFAGLVLVFARPFRVGDAIRLRRRAGRHARRHRHRHRDHLRPVRHGRQRDVHPQLTGSQRRSRSHPPGTAGSAGGSPRRARHQVWHSGSP